MNAREGPSRDGSIPAFQTGTDRAVTRTVADDTVTLGTDSRQLAFFGGGIVIDPSAFHVYVFHDPLSPLAGHDRPLYVGKSSSLFSRLGRHLSSREQRSLVGRVEIVACDTRFDMDALERQLIKLHQPVWNVRGIGEP